MREDWEAPTALLDDNAFCRTAQPNCQMLLKLSPPRPECIAAMLASKRWMVLLTQPASLVGQELWLVGYQATGATTVAGEVGSPLLSLLASIRAVLAVLRLVLPRAARENGSRSHFGLLFAHIRQRGLGAKSEERNHGAPARSTGTAKVLVVRARVRPQSGAP